MKKMKQVPVIEVGIISCNEASITLNGDYLTDSGQMIPEGKWLVKLISVKITLINGAQEFALESGIQLRPGHEDSSSFVIHSVTIGVDFHWQRNEDQVFKGNLKLIIEDGKLVLVNVLSLEDYLISVISSEMKATASIDLLKAHAVISRSWLLAQMEKKSSLGINSEKYNTSYITENEIIRWYDREDHKSFDVCADDHCQRYQGITRASTSAVVTVIEETFGEVLTYNGSVCDTRYSKCCGGITELFENAWEPVSHPYLQRVIDNPFPPAGYDLNINMEKNAEIWISGNPDSFCSTTDKNILSQVLNDYDQETNDFFRWKVTYTQDELSLLVKSRTGIDFGVIEKLTALERGSSGRITKLKIDGSKRTMVIGKELEIRKALSKTHLYSSCFIVEKKETGKVISFVLNGAGWGHGVGLCQIGAAVMGSKGYSYRDILTHYFSGAVIEKRY
jgi:stage II sporulation protein D